jgi:hypothetical protein
LQQDTCHLNGHYIDRNLKTGTAGVEINLANTRLKLASLAMAVVYRPMPMEPLDVILLAAAGLALA